MCSAMAPGPCKATHGSGQGSRGQRCFPLPSEDPEHPPPPRRQERTALQPPREPRCRPSARGCRTKPSAARPAAAQRGGSALRPAAAPGSRAVPARVRTDPGLRRAAGSGSKLTQAAALHPLSSLCAERRAPGSYRDAGWGGQGGPAPRRPLERARRCPALDGAGGRHKGRAASRAGQLPPGVTDHGSGHDRQISAELEQPVSWSFICSALL